LVSAELNVTDEIQLNWLSVCPALVNIVMDLRPTIRETISFSITLLHGIHQT
jgi:hypothetical protein